MCAAMVAPADHGRRFSASQSTHDKRRMSVVVEEETHFGPALTVSMQFTTDNQQSD